MLKNHMCVWYIYIYVYTYKYLLLHLFIYLSVHYHYMLHLSYTDTKYMLPKSCFSLVTQPLKRNPATQLRHFTHWDSNFWEIHYQAMNWRSLRHFSSLLLMVQKSSDHQLRLVAYPNIYRALYIPSGARFLPSTVSTVGITFDLNKKNTQFTKFNFRERPPKWRPKKKKQILWVGKFLNFGQKNGHVPKFEITNFLKVFSPRDFVWFWKQSQGPIQHERLVVVNNPQLPPIGS